MTTAVEELGVRARAAARVLALTPTAEKNAALEICADMIIANQAELTAANNLDLESAQAGGMDATPLDRLRLTPERIASMAAGLRQVAHLPDPVGEVIDGVRRPNGLEIERVRVPLGVVAVIYENRPNVTCDAAGICIKSGNASLLRGSSTAQNSNITITGILRTGLAEAGLPSDAVLLVEDPSHQSAIALMQLTDYVDCLIPRGGPDLIASIREHATVPVIIDGDGNCHVYVDQDVDFEEARAIVLNAKTNRPGVCNSAESLIVHAAIADDFLPLVAKDLVNAGVELRGDKEACARFEMLAATEEDFAREFLDLTMSVVVVPELEDAIAHINRYGSGHTEAIVTSNLDSARRFTREVDAAAVIVNASTRFTDGERFGFGAEIGISTQKLHARGPMGLRELTTYKYLVWGSGQVVS